MKTLEDIDFLEFVGNQESQFLGKMGAAEQEILDRFAHGVQAYGQTLPWVKTHGSVRVRPREVSIWAGINGHGKSMLLSHVIAHASKGESAVIASLEMPIYSTAHRMLRQIIGTANPTPEAIKKAIEWTDQNIWVYDQLDTVEPERIIGMAIYCMKELGIQHVVIDSLMKCGLLPDDYNSQQKFVDRLCWVAKTYGGHIHLVHHVRKGDKEESIPDKFAIKGAGGITDLVDNVFIVHRNKAKEKAVEKGEEVNEWVPDATLTVAKQRHGEWEGQIDLWFDKNSQQYLGQPNGKLEWYEIGKIKKPGQVPPGD